MNITTQPEITTSTVSDAPSELLAAAPPIFQLEASHGSPDARIAHAARVRRGYLAKAGVAFLVMLIAAIFASGLLPATPFGCGGG